MGSFELFEALEGSSLRSVSGLSRSISETMESGAIHEGRGVPGFRGRQSVHALRGRHWSERSPGTPRNVRRPWSPRGGLESAECTAPTESEVSRGVRKTPKPGHFPGPLGDGRDVPGLGPEAALFAPMKHAGYGYGRPVGVTRVSRGIPPENRPKSRR